MASQPDGELSTDSDLDSVFADMQSRKASAQSENAEEEEDEELEPEQSEFEDEEESEELEEEEAPKPKAKVKVGEDELDLDEVVAGYMKDGDYRRKTAEVAESRRQVEQLHHYVSNELASRVQNLDVLTQAMQRELIGDSAMLEQLIRTDPAQYLVKKHELDAKANLFQQAHQQRQALEQQHAQYAQHQQAEHLQIEQQRLLERMPSWRDSAKAQADQIQIAETLAKSYGYTTEELAGISDHRALMVAMDAMRWRKHVELNKKQTVKSPPSAIRSNQPQSQGSQRQTKEAMQRLSRTGSMDDALNALQSLRKR